MKPDAEATRSRTLCKEMHRYGLHKFVILAIEQVTYTAPCDVQAGSVATHRRREQFWQSGFYSRVGSSGFNDIRLIRQKSRPHTSSIDPRMFQQRVYDLKAEHLLQHFVRGRERLTGAHFAGYGDKKLLHFVAIWSHGGTFNSCS